MKKCKNTFIIVLVFLLLAGCTQDEKQKNKNTSASKDLGAEPQKVINLPPPNESDYSQKMGSQNSEEFNLMNTGTTMTDAQLKTYLYNKFQTPKLWGEFLPGIMTSLNTANKYIALTFDACGGPNGSGYDSQLIYYLRQQNIPATLFINSRWIDSNYNTFMALSKIPLFEIENHGTQHRPLSMNGREAWGIKGTQNVNEITDEVLNNDRKIKRLIGRTPYFFRSGTAYYDETGIRVAKEIGEQPVNYNVLGDAGATFKKEQVRDALFKAAPGSIVLMHMNHPEGETFEGLKLAIPELKNRGFKFVRLADIQLK
ncbi:polysaccharide deacetylase family protein [Neobacillus terrae]|uniref:polysaccharide deacetylase family protein n=1 Tax=Neobacillus terrae TaxID=3034837 RepID=UPI00140E0672|nr:polysaccharide deacetylase family protein [Neobacillus terrae]NHM29538.1 polysaccharide deacetylase family protein [Neobacillus terrae]